MSHSRTGPIRANFQTQPQNLSSHATSHGSAPSKAKVPIQYSALEMKRKLTGMLEKEKCEIYLRILGQMLTGDLVKADFDKQIKMLLTEEQRKLHNLFVITLLRSAYGSIATTNTQRRNVKVAPLVPRLGAGSRELAKQPIWSKIKAKMSAAAFSQGLGVDNEAVSAIMIGLEHHLKSIMSVAQPTQRAPQRIMVSPFIQHLAKLENKDILEMTKKGDITAKNICSALNIIPNVFQRKRINFDDDINFYHAQNHFAHVHYINFEVAKQEKYFRHHQQQEERVVEFLEPQSIGEQRAEVLEDMEPQFNNENNSARAVEYSAESEPRVEEPSTPTLAKSVLSPQKPAAKSAILSNSASKRKGVKK